MRALHHQRSAFALQMGYGTRSLELLTDYYEGKVTSLAEAGMDVVRAQAATLCVLVPSAQLCCAFVCGRRRHRRRLAGGAVVAEVPSSRMKCDHARTFRHFCRS